MYVIHIYRYICAYSCDASVGPTITHGGQKSGARPLTKSSAFENSAGRSGLV